MTTPYQPAKPPLANPPKINYTDQIFWTKITPETAAQVSGGGIVGTGIQ